jgi:hypothetical protein
MAAAVLAACAPAEQRQQPIRPALEVESAARGRPVLLRYSWELGPDAAPVEKGYQAFVHFTAGGRLVFADDHVPVPPPEEWKPGQTYRYARARFLPVPDGVARLDVRMGLYSPAGGRRVPLVGEHSAGHEYNVAEVAIAATGREIPVVYREGWYMPDRAPEGITRTWTAREAKASFRNPHEDVVVYLEAETNSEAMAGEPALDVVMGEHAAHVSALSPGLFLRGFRFPAAALGAGRSTDLRLALGASFVPREHGLSSDHRELGLFVHHLAVVPVREATAEGIDVVDALPLTPSGD